MRHEKVVENVEPTALESPYNYTFNSAINRLWTPSLTATMPKFKSLAKIGRELFQGGGSSKKFTDDLLSNFDDMVSGTSSLVSVTSLKNNSPIDAKKGSTKKINIDLNMSPAKSVDQASSTPRYSLFDVDKK